jgi:hypothetical protein
MPEVPKSAAPETETRVIRGEVLTAYLFGGTVLIVVVGCGVLNILAAKGGWNPFHWQGRFWTGVLMIAAPAPLIIMAILPAEVRKNIPEQAVVLGVLALWIAIFWAACGGR